MDAITRNTNETKNESKKNVMNGKKKRGMSTYYLVAIGLLSALSYVLMLLESPPYLGFLRVEFSDIPAIIGAFHFGPMAGVFIELVKNLVKFLTASKTSGIGELANFLVSIAYVVPAAICYKRIKGKYKYQISFGIATLSMTIMGFVVNYFITIPMYAKLSGGIQNVLNLASIIPIVQDKFTLILYGISPFNVAKGILMGVVSYYSYKYFKNKL